jgi:hypothetical protein
MIIKFEYEQSKNIMDNLMLNLVFNIVQQVSAGGIKWN